MHQGLAGGSGRAARTSGEHQVIRYFDNVGHRSREPFVDPVLSTMYHGVEVSPWRSWAAPDKAADPLHIIRNTYRLPRISMVSQNLIGDTEVGRRISQVADVRLRPIRVVRSFEYPYRAGDDSYEHDSNFARIAARTADMSEIFAEWSQFLPESTCPELLEISVFNGDKNAEDLVTTRIGDPSIGLFSRECYFSKREVVRRGLVWGGGLFCSEEVYKIIRRDLDSPFWGVIEV